MIEYEEYRVADPDSLETPAMLVFEEKVDGNINALCELVGGGENLMVHVKTHKSAAIVEKQIAAGIAGFKCATLKELEMVLAAGAQTAILAYQMAQRVKVERFADLAAAYPEAHPCAVISAPLHLDLLAAVAAERQQKLEVMG